MPSVWKGRARLIHHHAWFDDDSAMPASRYATALKTQLAEIDRRPKPPRQLAGAKGNSEVREKSVAMAAVPLEPADGAADTIGPDAFAGCVAAGDATIDVSFKPKCRGIRVSPPVHSGPTPEVVP